MVSKVTALALTGLLLVGCGDPQPAAPAPDITGEWVLAAGTGPDGDVPVPDVHAVTLYVEADQLGGTAACNQYRADYEMDGDALVISEVTQTEMACQPPEVMEAEQRYLAALSAVEQAGRDGDALLLSGPDTELRFEPAEG